MSSDILKLPDDILAQFLHPNLKKACEIFFELFSPVPSLSGMLGKISGSITVFLRWLSVRKQPRIGKWVIHNIFTHSSPSLIPSELADESVKNWLRYREFFENVPKQEILVHAFGTAIGCKLLGTKQSSYCIINTKKGKSYDERFIFNFILKKFGQISS
ncbi:hypothetical protein DFH09DRAFT_1102278 [Mycena vulgaris]|nr:hypothetical protein DFH09DRAFT_1102278 [Mycena vulgaris]